MERTHSPAALRRRQLYGDEGPGGKRTSGSFDTGIGGHLGAEALARERRKQGSTIINITVTNTESRFFSLDERPPRPWTRGDLVCLAVIAVFSFATRLYKIGIPGVVLFDEVHFVSMAQWYAGRTYFFDIHPPLGKLVLATIVWLTGFPTDVPYRDIGKAYQHDGYFYMRLWQGCCGGLLPIIAFLTIRQLRGTSRSACFLAGAMVILENSFTTISRAVLLDAFLYAAMAASLLFAVKMWQDMELETIRLLQSFPSVQSSARLRGAAAAAAASNRGRSDDSRFWTWALLCSTCLAIACSIKHTALGMVGTIGLIHIGKTFVPPGRRLLHILRTRDAATADLYEKATGDEVLEDQALIKWTWRMFVAGCMMIAFIVALYIFCFFLHFVILTHTGVDEDSMNDNFRSQLIGSNVTLPEGEEPQGVWQNIVDINKKMIEINNAVRYEDYATSSWYQWPIMWNGVMYQWAPFASAGRGGHKQVYLFGNPILYWLVLLVMILTLFYCDNAAHLVLSRQVEVTDRKKANLRHMGLCFLGYLANWLPYPLLVPRPTYMYHYHPSLYFGILATGLMFDVIANSVLRKNNVAKLLLLGIILGGIGWSYYHFLPFSFFWPLTDEEHNARRWFRSFFTKW